MLGAVRCRHSALLHGFPGALARRVLLHGYAGAIRGFATWIWWGVLKDVLWMDFWRFCSVSIRESWRKVCRVLIQGIEEGSAACVPGESEGGFGRDEGVWWLLSHVLLCKRNTRSLLKKHLVQSVYN